MKSEAKRLVFILEVGALGLGLWKEFSQGSSSQQKEGNLCLKRVITPEGFSKRKEKLEPCASSPIANPSKDQL